MISADLWFIVKMERLKFTRIAARFQARWLSRLSCLTTVISRIGQLRSIYRTRDRDGEWDKRLVLRNQLQE